jgi:hypothetical protein
VAGATRQRRAGHGGDLGSDGSIGAAEEPRIDGRAPAAARGRGHDGVGTHLNYDSLGSAC